MYFISKFPMVSFNHSVYEKKKTQNTMAKNIDYGLSHRLLKEALN